jgi:hypothetical protein
MAFFLERKGTNATPYVLIDEAKNYMKLEGLSFHENSPEFYQDIVEWLGEYLEGDFGTFTFDSHMKYFNSTTTKILFNMLEMMSDNAAENKKVVVNWHVSPDDDLLKELCEDMAEDYGDLEINLITVLG